MPTTASVPGSCTGSSGSRLDGAVSPWGAITLFVISCMVAGWKAIRLSRMAVARDMVAQLGLCVYTEDLYSLGSGRRVSWIRYNLLAREIRLCLSLGKRMEHRVAQK